MRRIVPKYAAAMALMGLGPVVLAQPGPPSDQAFLRNEGQWPAEVLYRSRSEGANVSLLRTGLSFSTAFPLAEADEGDPEKQGYLVWNLDLGDAGPDTRITSDTGVPSVHSFLRGPDARGYIVHPQQVSRITYHAVQPGVDVVLYHQGDGVKYDHRVHAGTDPASVRCHYRGIKELRIDAEGHLLVRTGLGVHRQHAPVSWQVVAGERRPVQVDYVLHGDSTYGFRVQGAYDPDADLIIDPLFDLLWASYTGATGGSNNINYCFANAMDPQGNVYLTGMVDSSFPTTPGSYSGPGNVVPEVFVAKFSSDGSTMLYSTYLPGNSSEFGTSIAVDALGRAYVTGKVDLNITNMTTYPSTANAYQPVHALGPDAMLTVLDPTGSSLVYSSFLGGDSPEDGFGIALGPPGIAYVTGTTSFIGFPEVNATAYPHGGRDIYVTKFDIDQSGPASVVYSLRVGSVGDQCQVHGISVDAAGNAYVTGGISSNSGALSFPVTPGAYSSTYTSGQDGLCALLFKVGNTLPASIDYATFLGPGMGGGVDVDPLSGEAYVTGRTRTFAFPTTAGALQPVHGADMFGNANNDAFVMKLDATGSSLLYSTFLGGPKEDEGTDIVVNAQGEAYVTGLAHVDFPTSAGAYQETVASLLSSDIFVVHLNADGSAYGCGGSTLFGGSADEYYGNFYDYLAPSIDLLEGTGSGDVVSLSATTHSQDLPTTPGVYQPVKVNGIADQPFFLKLGCEQLNAPPNASFNTLVEPDCTGGLVQLFNTSAADTSWQWTFPGGQPASSTDQDPGPVQYAMGGQYTITLIVCNAFGCDTVQQTISVDPEPQLPVDLGPDTTLCAGDQLLLGPVPSSGSITWTLNDTIAQGSGTTLVVMESGSYSVQVTDSSGCMGSDTVVVLFTGVEAVVQSAVNDGVCAGGTWTFQAADGATAYEWSFGDGNTATGPSVAHQYSTTGTYQVQLVVSEGLCSDTVLLEVEGIPGPGSNDVDVVFPNVFSPNGDGINDVFTALGSPGDLACFTLHIYDRWGLQLFEGSGAGAPWDGRSQSGGAVPDGVYYYVAEVGGRVQRGTVHVLR
ncbi:MAG TPA: PKD domain-containing protein [Flavobacteriales bacterium]|nr:PKD domain-containing protein [Flavobacteriales bacterium]